ncbi:MAG TPA: hypothetical protein VKR83_19240 [Ktedonobacteraceae bacterium]|nr:hypothetical protein [Ktedonobacteraceae bacterium]
MSLWRSKLNTCGAVQFVVLVIFRSSSQIRELLRITVQLEIEAIRQTNLPTHLYTMSLQSLKKAGLLSIRFHDLRHRAATISW